MNPTAIIFWALLALIGYFIGGTINSSLIGLAIGLSISFIADITSR